MATYFTASLFLLFCISTLCAADFDNFLRFKTNQYEDEKDEGSLWVLIVAGSSSWWNYRHQADACHAYQIVHSHGIPDERIVVMMYDDIANNEDNPTPGKIINRPNGPDVYHGVPKDYISSNVSPEHFLWVLEGNKTMMNHVGSGKVIDSGPNDRIFVYFTDHGAPGIIGFPEDELMATDLMNTIQGMHKHNKYKEMVLYVEACESGSMFENLLPENINVFATTAANSVESSYACYFDSSRNTYLGDVYSVKWMEDSDSEDLRKETLKEQFGIVRNETNTSHVMEFGDLSISNEKVANYQGKGTADSIPTPKVPLDPVPSPDVHLRILQNKRDNHVDALVRGQAAEEIERMMQERQMMKTLLLDIMTAAIGPAFPHLPAYLMEQRMGIKEWGCYAAAKHLFNDKCIKISEHEYSLRLLYGLVNLCEIGVQPSAIRDAIITTCTPRLKDNISLFGRY